MLISLSEIFIDHTAQSRESMNWNVVGDYTQALEQGTVFPPLVVFFDGKSYWLADGFHRMYAAKRLKFTEIECEVRTGNLRDAVLHSVSANAQHGLRRKPEDKRKAVLQLLNDPEWSQWSSREIAKRCLVGHKLVDSLKLSLCGAGATKEVYMTRCGKTSKVKIRRSSHKSSKKNICENCEQLKMRILELEQEKEEKKKEKREERKESNKEKKEEKKESKKEEKEVTLSPAGREFRESLETHHECRVGQLTSSEITSQRTAIKRLWNFSSNGIGSEQEFLACYDALAQARYASGVLKYPNTDWHLVGKMFRAWQRNPEDLLSTSSPMRLSFQVQNRLMQAEDDRKIVEARARRREERGTMYELPA